jgi:hypothetical protein
MDDLKWIEEVSELFSRMNCLIDEQTAENLLTLYLTEDDPTEKMILKQEIQSLLSLYSNDLIFSAKPVLASPSPENCKGEILLGKIIQGDFESHEFRIGLEDLQRHVGIFASTGSGKTTLIINILRQLMELPNPIPFLYFDFKRDLRHLTDYPIVVLRHDWLKINPLKPPKGVSKKLWMMILSDIMAHVLGWFYASENYLMGHINRLYKRYKKSYPTFRELYEIIAETEEKSRRYSEYRDVVLNRLESMLIVLEDALNCEKGFPLEELLKYPVVLELDGLRRDEANFLVELLLAYIFAYRKANNQRGSLKHLLVFDEATRIFFKAKQYRETTIELGLPFVDTVPQIIRDYQEGIIFALQEPSIVSHSVMANTNLKLVGFLGDGQDIDTVAKSLNLNEEERSAITKLEKGEWLVKKSNLKPFIIRSQDFPLQKNVNDKQLEERMHPFLAKMNSAKIKVKATQTNALPVLSEDAKKLLKDVNKHPFRGLATRYKVLRLSARKGEQAKKELLLKKAVGEIKVKLGKYRPVKFLIPTALGLRCLSNMGEDTKLWQYIGKVGFHHRLYQVLCAYSLRKLNYETFIEKDIDGKRVDVLAVKGNRKIGIEVQLNSDLNLEKISTILENVDELVILCSNSNVLSRINVMLQKTDCERIRLELVNEFLEKVTFNPRRKRSGNNFVKRNKLKTKSNVWNKAGKKEG